MTQQADALKTARTTVKRKAQRGAYDFETIAAILDEALFCHIGFVVDGQPYVLPTGFGRKDRTLYIHGLSTSNMIERVGEGIPMCFTAMLVDALVLARSAFNHSVNYRSVVVLGKATLVPDERKMEALQVITDHLVPGRWDQVRGPSKQEFKATSVLELPITEASAKIRSGPPGDDEEDYAIPVWAGEIRFRFGPEALVPCPRLIPGVTPTENVSNYRRPSELKKR